MARTAKGGVLIRGGIVYARVTLRDGRRVSHKLGTVAEVPKGEARRLATVVSDAYRTGRYVHPTERARPAPEAPAAPPAGSLEEWWGRWYQEREEWVSDVASERSKYTKRIRPILGALPIATITREDCERLVEHLDELVDEGVITEKTATNTWGIAQSIFRDASQTKTKSLRVRPDDPTIGVAPPDEGETKARVYLYPVEALQLLACEDIPRERRELYALACYAGLRASELAALRWSDVDPLAGVIDVTKAVDRSSGELRSTKNHETRRVPVSPALAPLLEEMRKRGRGAGGEVVAVHPWGLARELRRDLHTAQLTRRALFDSTPTTKRLTFHDLRATAVTWWALEGLPLHVVMRRAGHRTPATAMGYIREAESLGRAIGTPFPALPLDAFRIRISDHGDENRVENRSHFGDLNPKKHGETTTNPQRREASGVGFGGVSVPFTGPVADWRDRFGALVDKLERAALEGACIELRAVANDVVEAWRAA